MTAEAVAACLNRARSQPGALINVAIEAIAAAGGDVVIRTSKPFVSLAAFIVHNSTMILAPFAVDGNVVRAIVGVAALVGAGEEEGRVTINVDVLTEAKLIDLNHRVVERLSFLQHIPAHASMLEFYIGERVAFRPDGRPPVKGMLVRYNRKSITVVTDDGHRWTVSPALLSRVVAVGAAQRQGTAKPGARSNVIAQK